MQKITTVSLFSLLLFVGWEKKQPRQSYLALGDSYTIGESVPEKARWPIQLVKALEEKNILIDSPKIIAKTGWTTEDLQKGIDAAILAFPYDWVSLLIGVHNQYQGKSLSAFKLEFAPLLSPAILFA